MIVGGLALSGVAMGISNPAMSSTVAHAVDQADLGVAGASQQMVMQIGVTFGIQLMQTVQQVREPVVGLTSSYSQAYLAAAVLAVLCVVAASGVRRAAPRHGHVEEAPVGADALEAELAGVPVPEDAPLATDVSADDAPQPARSPGRPVLERPGP